MNLNITDTGSTIEVSESIFGCKFNEPLVHQVVTAYLAGSRQGTCKQKNRAEVRGGGRKPWSQKGSGRARAGTIRSPIWVGGGRAFAARPQDYSQKVNRKMYRSAMRCILSALVREERIIALECFKLPETKTSHMVIKLKELGLTKALLITEKIEQDLYLASRNIPKVKIINATNINPVALMNSEKLVMTVSAIRKIEDLLT